MPIQSPNLDDLRYDRIVQELIRRIPAYTPEWTDFNDSDPGITVLQLFAYLAEQVGYRLNQVPEKNHIELLKLLGVRLRPALAARTRVAWFLSDPAAQAGFTLDAHSRLMGKGSTPAIFETDAALDLVPAEPVRWIATKNPFLWDLLRLEEGREPAPAEILLPKQIPAADCPWLAVVWDGKKPPAKEMPLLPVALKRTSAAGTELSYLWIGLAANLGRDAGFAGVTVTLTVQLDDDEQPDRSTTARCDPIQAAGENAPPAVQWLAYYDATLATMKPVPGRIDDTTEQLTRSGTLRFTVPFEVGPIPTSSFANLRDATTPTQVDACTETTLHLKDSLTFTPSEPASFDPSKFRALLTDALSAAQVSKKQTKPAVAHPLDPALRDPANVSCWLRIGPLEATRPEVKVRHMGFNVVGATHAITVTGELLGRADGKPGQQFQLAHGNVLAETLVLGVQESSDRTSPLVTWKRVDSLDGASPNDRVFELDAEAGTLRFGDGKRGRIVPLVPGGGMIIALVYRWGGGKSGEMDAATITVSAAQSAGIMGVTNFVAARGGRDTETLDGAKERARKELSTRSRAVTASDFEWITLQTPSVRVLRAIIVPRRRPLGATLQAKRQTSLQGALKTTPKTTLLSHPISSTSIGQDCGPALPLRAGLDDAFEAPGAVCVVVVPDEPRPTKAARASLVEPLPTPSFLREVCLHLDRYRLITTEVHVVPPQYLRLCRVYCKVRPRAGYTRLQLRDRIADMLGTFLDVRCGGEDGQGAPFGGQIHIAALLAGVLRTEGVERVEDLRAHFVRTKSNAIPREGNLLLCPVAADDFDRIDLGPEETTSIDLSTFTLDTV